MRRRLALLGAAAVSLISMTLSLTIPPSTPSSPAVDNVARSWDSRLEPAPPLPEPARASRSVSRKPLVKPKPRVEHLSVTGIALRIASCESGDHHGSINWRAQNRRSSASGGFQFLDSTWRGVTHLPGSAKDYPPSVQIAAFYKLWNGGRGARHWAASRSCWS